MKFGSVCSGIEAASVAFEPLGWKAAWLAEIEPAPSAVLAHRYPDVPNLGDMTALADRIEAEEIEAPDLLCGGCPCQSFSVAGLRKSLGDQRGNLTLEFIRIADAIDRVRRSHGKQPAWVLYENVPGILSTKDNAFGSFLGGLCGGDTALEQPADGWTNAGVVAGPSRVIAWRVLDAQYFGVAQRRRRVFVLALGGAGGWACADALLPIGHSLSGHPAPRRETGQRASARTAQSLAIRGRDGTPQAELGGEVANAILTPSGGRAGIGVGAVLTGVHAPPISPALKSRDYKGPSSDGDGDGSPLVVVTHGSTAVPAICFDSTQITSAANRSNQQPGDPCHTLAKGAHPPTIAFSAKDYGGDAMVDCSPTLRAGGHDGSHANAGVMPAIAFGWQNSAAQGDSASEHHTPTLDKSKTPAVAMFGAKQAGSNYSAHVAPTLDCGGGGGMGAGMSLHMGMQVRRLTPRECERLQGFPDDWTLVPHRGKPMADGPRYKAIGNSWAVPCARWIGERIEAVEAICAEQERKVA